MKLIRSNSIDWKTTPRDVNDGDVARIIRVLNRENDYALTLDEIVDRYARAIAKIKDKESGVTTERLTRVNASVETAIREGFYEVLHLRWLPRIGYELATLWTEPGLDYTYTIGDTPHEPTKALIDKQREDGGDELVMPMVDAMAVLVGTAGEYIAHEAGSLRYQPVALNAIFVAHAGTITDGDKERLTNTTSLEEASVVVLRMGTNSENSKGVFAAWFGRSTGDSGEWLNGRHVRYEATTWNDIPPPGGGGVDYTTSGEWTQHPAPDELANPLTLWSNGNGDEAGPEYPIALFYEDALSQSSKLLRCTGYSRYKSNMEFDVGASRIFGSALKSARGVFAFQNDSNRPLPNGWDEGMVQMYKDQLLQVFSVPGINTKYAMDVVSRNMRLAAEAEGVAGYLVDADTANEASGVSLHVQNFPMIRRRRQRIKANRPGQRRKFNIERALLNSVDGKATLTIPMDVRENWNPGQREFPEDQTATVDNAIKRWDGGAINRVEFVRLTFGLPNSDAAKAKIIEMDAEANDAEHGELFGFKTTPAAAAPADTSMLGRVRAARGGTQ